MSDRFSFLSESSDRTIVARLLRRWRTQLLDWVDGLIADRAKESAAGTGFTLYLGPDDRSPTFTYTTLDAVQLAIDAHQERLTC